MDAVGLTGRLTAALRARESTRVDRLFDDPLADRLAADGGRPQFVILAAGMGTRAFRGRLGIPSSHSQETLTLPMPRHPFGSAVELIDAVRPTTN
ncbi:MAG TPA: hypothetical protein VFX16_28575 [Pseudonocardiaceae bacterium]|nr:hypothetical protein [Pseudonocardiaceae bacterium]